MEQDEATKTSLQQTAETSQGVNVFDDEAKVGAMVAITVFPLTLEVTQIRTLVPR